MTNNLKLLIALGNPGPKYEKTRHNAAWLWVDHYFGDLDYQFNKYGNYDFAKTNMSLPIESDLHSIPRQAREDESVTASIDFVIIKPRTFMNNSGLAVSQAIKHYGISRKTIIVVHDDVDLEIGQYKISCNRGSGGHNGIESINKALGTAEYCRLRLGVRPLGLSPSVKADTYVLGKFQPEELKTLLSLDIDLKHII